ncbi:hypothetical protein RJT34_26636 [Clitoria ternatea]|uniref:NAC domain-containing protein n=1 Tax=Clitoria ternatea TaxID=43366 RepID=A0AAN9F6X8_CLITE
MESFQGGIKLPIGFRFCPTDEELLIHYLKKKAFAQQLPASVISEFDVFQTDPWHLPGDSREKKYFFRKGIVFGNINTGSGYWKSIGKEKQIVLSQNNQVIGIRKTLIFCKLSNGARTRWVMHELRLLTSYPCQMALEDFAVYRIFQKEKMKTKGSQGKVSSSKLERSNETKASFIDFTAEFRDQMELPPPCSP